MDKQVRRKTPAGFQLPSFFALLPFWLRRWVKAGAYQLFPNRRRLQWPLAVAMGIITALVTGLTMAFDDGVGALLSNYPNVFIFGDVITFVFSAGLAIAIYWVTIGRPIRLVSVAVRQMAEHRDDIMPVQATSRLSEIQNLINSIIALRGRLIGDEQRAMRLASDMIQVAKVSGDWLWKADHEHRFTEILNVNPDDDATDDVLSQRGLHLTEVATHLEDREKMAQLQMSLSERRSFRDFRYRRQQEDGSVFWYSMSGIPTFDSKDRFIGYRGTSRNVTTEVVSEEGRGSLIALNSRLAAAIAQSNDGIALIDPNQEGSPVVYVNASFSRITGHDAEGILGQPSFLLESHCADDSVRTRLADSIEARRRYKGLIPTRRPDGSTFWNDLTVTPVHDDGDDVTGFVWSYSDVSSQVEQEKKDAEDAARQAQNQKMEALGTLAGGIAHDLNNTLVPVLGLSKLLLTTTKDDAQRKPLDAIVNASERARSLVKQILDFSRANTSDLHAIDFAAEMKKIFTVIRAAIATTAVLDLDIKNEGLWVLFDPGKLYQILINLTANSFDALPDGKGHITLTLTQDVDKNSALLIIEDDGVGMSPETLKRAMEPFFTTKDVGKGTGLGLSIIHGIITGLNGEIAISSTLGEGTKVEIFLPLVSPDKKTTASQFATSAAVEIAG